MKKQTSSTTSQVFNLSYADVKNVHDILVELGQSKTKVWAEILGNISELEAPTSKIDKFLFEAAQKLQMVKGNQIIFDDLIKSEMFSKATNDFLSRTEKVNLARIALKSLKGSNVELSAGHIRMLMKLNIVY